MERSLLWVAEGFYLLSFLISLFFLRSRVGSPYPMPVVLVGLGFIAHTGALYLRGMAIHACPTTNLFESLWFIAWAVVLIYLLVGGLFRLSFLSAFAIPVVVALGLVALVLPLDQPRALTPFKSPWLGLHASFSLVAYGSFAVACITGIMYLVQEHQLKSHKLYPLFHRLPPIENLDRINYRLLLAGLMILSLGMVFGLLLGTQASQQMPPKMPLSFLIWAVYAALLAARMTGRLRGRKVAVGSVALFLFLMATLRFMISVPA